MVVKDSVEETAPLLNENTPLLRKNSVQDDKNDTAHPENQDGESAIKQASSSSDEHSSSHRGYTKEQKLTGFTVALLNTALQISFAVIAPFFPAEAAKKGATSTEVGLIFGAFQIVIFITSPIYGCLINRIGVRYMFLAGSFLCGGCNIVFGFLDELPNGNIYIIMCFISRCVEANGASMMTTASFAIMASQFKHNVGSALGILKTFAGIGMVLGPSIGGGLYTIGGYKAPFIFVGSFVLLCAAVSYVILPNIEDVTIVKETMFGLLKIPGCFIVYLITMGNAMSLSFLDPTLSNFIKQNFNLSVGDIGLVFVIDPAVYALASPITGWLSDKGWLGSLLVIGLFGNAVSFFLLGPAPFLQSFIPLTLAETIIALCLLGLTLAPCLIPVFPLVINLARVHGYPEGLHTLGLISGYFNSAGALGAFIGPSAAGYFAEKFGFAWSAAIFGIIIASLGVIMVTYICIMKLFCVWPVPTLVSNDAISNDTASNNRTITPPA